MKRQRSLLFVYATVFGAAVLGGYLQINSNDGQIAAESRVAITNVVATSSAPIALKPDAAKVSAVTSPANVRADDVQSAVPASHGNVVSGPLSDPVLTTDLAAFSAPPMPTFPIVSLPSELDTALQIPTPPSVQKPSSSPQSLSGAVQADDAHCSITLTGAARPSALVDLSLKAPCLKSARFVVHHEGLMFTAVTDPDGTWSNTMPAMTEQANFRVAFETGDGAVAQIHAADAADYQRAALQWSGDAAFALHAYLNGARFGENGHFWHQTSGETATFVTRLGDASLPDAQHLEVFSAPKSNIDSRQVALSVELEVTQATCNTDVDAQIASVDVGFVLREIAIAAPGCGAVGEFLMLNNMF